MEQTNSQQPLKISDEIERLRGRLADQLTETKGRLSAAEEALSAATAEVEVARKAAAEAQAQFDSYSGTFPAPVTPAKAKAKSAGSPSAVAPKNGASVKSQATGARVVMNRPAAKTSDKLTVPERVARVMGNRTMTAGGVLEALEQANERFESNNPRSYVSTTLNSAMMNVAGPEGDIRDRTGKLVKVHVFTATERGHYRVATEQDIQTELRKILGASEVVISENLTPADKVFADQGMDVRAALGQAAHH